MEAECWFWRILATVDDFGNMQADPTICYNLTVGHRQRLKPDQVNKWLLEMERQKLILFYVVGTEKFLHVFGFEDMQPAGKNGKRLQRHPLPRLGESGCIRVNPDVSSASQASDNDNDNDNQYDNDHDTRSEQPLRAERSAGRQATRLPENFALSPEMEAWASKNAPRVDLVAALDEFRDYWAGIAGARGRKLDWNATFRNRLRELESRKGTNGTHKSGGYQTNAERRDADFRGYESVITELRGRSSGTTDEDVRGKPIPPQ